LRPSAANGTRTLPTICSCHNARSSLIATWSIAAASSSRKRGSFEASSFVPIQVGAQLRQKRVAALYAGQVVAARLQGSGDPRQRSGEVGQLAEAEAGGGGFVLIALEQPRAEAGALAAELGLEVRDQGRGRPHKREDHLRRQAVDLRGVGEEAFELAGELRC
jgi:hypothetical protein